MYAAHGDAVVRELLKWIEYAVVFGAVVCGFAADPDDRPFWLALIGIGLFEVGAAVRGLLFGVRSWDVPTLAAVAAVLGIASLLASYIPARRAASVNPVEALRAE